MARLADDIENLRLMLDWYRDHGQGEVVAHVISELGLLWFWRGYVREMSGRLDSIIDTLGDDLVLRSRVHGILAWMNSAVGLANIQEHAERSADDAARAGMPTPVPALNGLGTYYMVFLGDTERAIEQTRRVTAAALDAGDFYWATWARLNRLFYTALLAPGADETLRLAEEPRRDIERTGSVVLYQNWLTGSALALRPVDPERALALLEEADAIATRENLREGIANNEFIRGLVLYALRRSGAAAVAWRRSLVGNHDMGNRRGMLNVLSAVVGVTAAPAGPTSRSSSSPACGADVRSTGSPAPRSSATPSSGSRS